MPDNTNPTKLLYPTLSYQLMNLVFEVHKQLGPGFSEEIYEHALMVELQQNGIPFESQKCIDVFYKGHNLGVFRLDLVIDGKIIIELKAVKDMNDLFRQQLLSYLRATGLRLGLLINFGNLRIQSVRVVA